MRIPGCCCFSSLRSILIALVHGLSLGAQQAAGEVLRFGFGLRRKVGGRLGARRLAGSRWSSGGGFGDVAAHSRRSFEAAAGEPFAHLRLAAAQALEKI